MSDRGDSRERGDRDDHNSRGRGEKRRPSGGERDGISLLVRNVTKRTRVEDLREEFQKFGEIRDVYMPRDFYTRQSKGFAFVEFKVGKEAEEAQHEMDGNRLDGNQITVVFAQERRKTADQMRQRERSRSPPRRRRGGRRSGSRSRSPVRRHGGRRSRSRSPPRRRRKSRSRSPKRSYSPKRSRSPRRSRSPKRSPSARNSPSPQRSRSPKRSKSVSRSPSERRTRSDSHGQRDSPREE